MTYDPDDLRAQFALESRLPGFWQVYRFRERRCPRGVEVPAGHYYAVFWRWSEPPVVGETLDELECAVIARMEAMPAELREPGQRSVIAELLGPEGVRFEITPGRWHLPGPPP